jgi:hypothetical protein
MAVVAGGAGLAAVFATSPGLVAYVPPCPIHALTGIDCPGCGMTRGTMSLLSGDVAGAVGHNALMFLLGLPMLALLWFFWLRDRVGGPSAADVDATTSELGSWYATVLFWKPQVALLVNEVTLLPLFMPFAPSATLLRRVPGALATLLHAHRVPTWLIEEEVAHAQECVLAPTRSRSVDRVKTEFTHLADHRRGVGVTDDLLDLSVKLARTPTSPLYKAYTSPDRALAALVDGIGIQLQQQRQRTSPQPLRGQAGRLGQQPGLDLPGGRRVEHAEKIRIEHDACRVAVTETHWIIEPVDTSHFSAP